MSARELADRNRRCPGELTARALERWLLEAGLATNGDGLLRPTARAVELAGALTILG